MKIKFKTEFDSDRGIEVIKLFCSVMASLALFGMFAVFFTAWILPSAGELRFMALMVGIFLFCMTEVSDE